MGIHINMFVNYLILNPCVKMTEMFVCEKILTTSGYGNQIYFQTVHWRRHTSKCCINISLLKYNTLVSINIFSGVVEMLKCSTCPRASYLKKVTCPGFFLNKHLILAKTAAKFNLFILSITSMRKIWNKVLIKLT
jgi:hypothetical protein